MGAGRPRYSIAKERQKRREKRLAKTPPKEQPLPRVKKKR